jgi:membrane peptidoglycan carboxypeptidase
MIKVKRYKKTIKKVRKFSLNKRTIFFFLIPGFLLLVGFIFFYSFILKDLPSPTKLSNNTASYSSQIYDRNGKLLYTLYSDKNQTFVPLAKIPKDLQEATIAIEDKDFYRHGAVDFRGITRAAYSIFVNKQMQGGSTLTQQLVKTSLLSPEQTLQRKVKEVILAFATEIMYSKDEILEMYLNQVPYGGTQYGVGAASQTFFGKDVSKLTLAENAYLAGLPESPSVLSPYGSHPERGKIRQQEILRKMLEQGYITREEYEKARKQELRFQKISNPIKAPHFVFYIRDLLIQKYGQQVVERGGLKIQTSLDLETQDFVQKTVAEEVANVKQYKVGNGAAQITLIQSKEVLT